MDRVQTKPLNNRRVLHGVFQPIFKTETPKIPAADINVEMLRSILQGEKFAPGSIAAFPEDFVVSAIRPWKVLGYQVCASPDQQTLTDYFFKKKFTARRNQLLTLILMIVEKGFFPLPSESEGDTARMIFPYTRILRTAHGPRSGDAFSQVSNFALIPSDGRWLLREELNPDFLRPGELLVLLEK